MDGNDGQKTDEKHLDTWHALPASRLGEENNFSGFHTVADLYTEAIPCFVFVLAKHPTSKKNVALALRVQFQHCRRVPSKRGICEHESSVIRSSRELFHDPKHLTYTTKKVWVR